MRNTVKFLSLKRNELAILHCISDYPTKVSDTQLANILLLKKIKYVVGFSDHTIGANSSCVAVALGANIIEKHITLDKNLPGPDHVCSLPCKDLKKFVENLNNVKTSISSTLRKLTKLERLTLRGNQISDITPIAENTGISGEITLQNNPLNNTALSTHIPALEARGIEVSYDISTI